MNSSGVRRPVPRNADHRQGLPHLHCRSGRVHSCHPQTRATRTTGHAFRGGRRQPLGMRAEHWYNWGNDAGACLNRHRHDRWCCPPIRSFWTGHASCQTLRRTPTTPHDVLLASARSEGRTAAKKQSVMATVEHLQRSVGCPDGASKMSKSVRCFAEHVCSWILVALDLKAAFQHVSSRAMLHSIEQHEPEGSTTQLCPYPRQQRH